MACTRSAFSHTSILFLLVSCVLLLLFATCAVSSSVHGAIAHDVGRASLFLWHFTSNLTSDRIVPDRSTVRLHPVDTYGPYGPIPAEEPHLSSLFFGSILDAPRTASFARSLRFVLVPSRTSLPSLTILCGEGRVFSRGCSWRVCVVWCTLT